jgi:hypothetical protein
VLTVFQVFDFETLYGTILKIAKFIARSTGHWLENRITKRKTTIFVRVLIQITIVFIFNQVRFFRLAKISRYYYTNNECL